jgi:hypothetical protein
LHILFNMFTPEEKMQLFSRLPALELSYEPKLHKKVYSALYYIIPKGPKALVWYTYWKDQHVCLLILLNERGNYSDIKLFPACFSDALALGTIIYGTHFSFQQRQYFTCEQLYYYKGMPMCQKERGISSLLLEMFDKEVEQVAYTTNSLVVGLPVITESYEEALALMEELPYRTYGIGGAPLQPPLEPSKLGGLPARSASTRSASLHPPLEPSKLGGVPLQPPGALPDRSASTRSASTRSASLHPPFAPSKRMQPHSDSNHLQGGVRGAPAPLLVKAGLSADTYMLYNPSDNTLVGTAMVPTYKNSVFLNGLFRNIKENKNLDSLEESDDEDEFENIQLDKFVNLEKKILMECVFLKRFQKWQPVKVIKMY